MVNCVLSLRGVKSAYRHNLKIEIRFVDYGNHRRRSSWVNVREKDLIWQERRGQLEVSLLLYPSYPFLILSCVHLVLIQGAVASSVLLRCR